METVTNVVNAATEAIWGKGNSTTQDEQRTADNETGGQEPLSGATGAGNADEPYDKGNALPIRTRNETGGQEPASGVQGAGTADEPFDQGNAEPRAVDDTAATTTGENLDHKEGEKLAKTEGPLMLQDEVDDKVTAINMLRNRTGSMALEDADELRKEIGTSEEWVKTSGVTADTENLDKAQPSAVKEEAPRLPEETNIKSDKQSAAIPEIPASTSEQPAETPAETPAEKPAEKQSKLGKLKEKLHIGSGKHS